ncbi:MAG: hypothetical protein R8G01_16240 [Ilumatobacteraceae bacterium]|nr:hypothetical protein [Ilumatobacteraceae bacterium]
MSHHPAAATTSHTSAPELALIERRLLEQAERGERQILELELILVDTDTIQEDRNSARAVLGSIRADVIEIRRALARIEAGTYGRCVTCGRAMPDERLQMIPFVARCAGCA